MAGAITPAQNGRIPGNCQADVNRSANGGGVAFILIFSHAISLVLGACLGMLIMKWMQ